MLEGRCRIRKEENSRSQEPKGEGLSFQGRKKFVCWEQGFLRSVRRGEGNVGESESESRSVLSDSS